jgi:hypothetical protein
VRFSGEDDISIHWRRSRCSVLKVSWAGNLGGTVPPYAPGRAGHSLSPNAPKSGEVWCTRGPCPPYKSAVAQLSNLHYQPTHGGVVSRSVGMNQARKLSHGARYCCTLLRATTIARRSFDAIFLSSTTRGSSELKHGSFLGAGLRRGELGAVLVISPRRVAAALAVCLQVSSRSLEDERYTKRHWVSVPYRPRASLTDSVSWRLPLSRHSKSGRSTTNSTRQSSMS